MALDALATLPPRTRAVVVLRYWSDLSVDQVADVLGCSPGNVKRLSSDAMGRLRTVLGDEMTGSGPPGRAGTKQRSPGSIRHG
jgi:DNA-directed RNA polymerase specialized sigma24 family protein